MNYEETLQFLYNALPMYHRIGDAAYKEGLDNTIALDNFLENPHKHFKTIHIAGTNGKGSVSHMLAAVLQKAGYRTGLYTSPHLKDFRERIRINGGMIPENAVTEFINKNKRIIDNIQPSFFEMTVALAFQCFRENHVEIAVIEAGMGGRLDSTNIISPLVSVITNIGLDHTQFLGNTPAAIAGEKAGIIKPFVPVIIGERRDETDPVFTSFARKNAAPLYFTEDHYQTVYSSFTPSRLQVLNIRKVKTGEHEDFITGLQGNYQQKNVPLVLQVTDVLRQEGIAIPEQAVHEGILEVKTLTGLRGRWEEIGHNPLTVCDIAHNREGFLMTIQQIRQTPWKNLHFVLGLVKDKELSYILPLLPTEAIYYFTRAGIPRALDQEILKTEAEKAGLKGKSYPSVQEAIRAAKKNAAAEDMIFIGGSTFVVAEALGRISDE